jgi:hypothetical protein
MSNERNQVMTISRTLVGLTGALAALWAPGGAVAGNLVLNGGFELTNNPFTGGLNGDKMPFVNAAPTYWTGGGGLTFLAAPGTADDTTKYLTVWGAFPTSSGPGISGGNFVMADGDPTWSASFSQMLTIPTAGLYTVNFEQAAGQEVNYSGPTTERWQVTLGSAGTQLSSLMSTPSHGVTPWQSESLTFNVPSAGNYLLEFLAVGTPSGLPPISFLDNVSVLPTPTTLAVAGMTLLGSVGRRARRS